jgi:hypothetical protein
MYLTHVLVFPKSSRKSKNTGTIANQAFSSYVSYRISHFLKVNITKDPLRGLSVELYTIYALTVARPLRKR